MTTRIERATLAARVRGALQANPIVSLLGPRQCGQSAAVHSGVAAARNASPFVG
jgi:predicted AAA+ superfamily ATPase